MLANAAGALAAVVVVVVAAAAPAFRPAKTQRVVPLCDV